MPQSLISVGGGGMIVIVSPRSPRDHLRGALNVQRRFETRHRASVGRIQLTCGSGTSECRRFPCAVFHEVLIPEAFYRSRNIPG